MMPESAKLREFAMRYTAAFGTGQRVRISGFELWKIGDDGLIADVRKF